MGQQKSTDVMSDKKELQQFEDDIRYQHLIDFKALNGLITDDEGKMKKLSMQELADMLQCDRGSLYNWMKRDGFWKLVNERRKEISPKSRLARVHEVMYLSALKPGAEGYRDRVLYLSNFDESFRMPTEKVEHSVADSWSALIESKNLDDEKVIEGEIVNASENDNA